MAVGATQHSFSGHESFPFRYPWLKKGFDAVRADGNVFLRDDAITTLGVGKNMVRSIRHWCLTAGVLEENHRNAPETLRPSELGALLLADDGLDPYLNGIARSEIRPEARLIPMPPTPEHVQLAEKQIVEQSKRIEFFLTEYSVELLANKMRNGDFEIPGYQREDTWEASRKSRFIESLLMGLPIPFLFFWESPETGKLEIVDGSQRLRTIEQFILGELVLDPLDELTELEGLAFSDLPESRQRKIKNRSIRGIVLNEHADEQARFDLFERINTGSKVANKAEVRRGALTGPFLNLVIQLAKDPAFIELAPVPEKSVNMREREELVTRFFAYGDGLEGYRDRPSDFLFKYAKKMNEFFTEHPDEVEVYRQRFAKTMGFVKNVFPFGFRRKEGGTATPRTRFEAIAIGSYLALQTRPTLAEQPNDVMPWLTGKEFSDITGSDGANVVKKLKGRLEYVRNQLLGA